MKIAKQTRKAGSEVPKSFTGCGRREATFPLMKTDVEHLDTTRCLRMVPPASVSVEDPSTMHIDLEGMNGRYDKLAGFKSLQGGLIRMKYIAFSLVDVEFLDKPNASNGCLECF